MIRFFNAISHLIAIQGIIDMIKIKHPNSSFAAFLIISFVQRGSKVSSNSTLLIFGIAATFALIRRKVKHSFRNNNIK